METLDKSWPPRAISEAGATSSCTFQEAGLVPRASSSTHSTSTDNPIPQPNSNLINTSTPVKLSNRFRNCGTNALLQCIVATELLKVQVLSWSNGYRAIQKAIYHVVAPMANGNEPAPMKLTYCHTEVRHLVPCAARSDVHQLWEALATSVFGVTTKVILGVPESARCSNCETGNTTVHLHSMPVPHDEVDVQAAMKEFTLSHRCAGCGRGYQNRGTIGAPQILVVRQHGAAISMPTTVVINDRDMYKLCAILDHENNHYTAFVAVNEVVFWCNDETITRKDAWPVCHAVLAFYVKCRVAVDEPAAPTP